MSRDSVEEFEVSGLTVKIEYDTDPESPRAWGNLSKMVCWHSRYSLGDEQPSKDASAYLTDLLPEKVAARLERFEGKAAEKIRCEEQYSSDTYLRRYRELHNTLRNMRHTEIEKVAVMLPLYLYDHSGITISTAPFSCPWDSGQVGFIYVTLEDVRKEYSCKNVTAKIRAKVEAQLRQEVETYDEYLTGQVYGYVVEDAEGEEIDSCWGFYGLEYCKTEARESAENAAKKEA